MMVSTNCQKHSKAWTEGDRETEREREREEWREWVREGRRGSNASIALLAGLDSSLHSFWCSYYKEKETEREREKEGDRRGERQRETKAVFGSSHVFPPLLGSFGWLWTLTLASVASEPLITWAGVRAWLTAEPAGATSHNRPFFDRIDGATGPKLKSIISSVLHFTTSGEQSKSGK